MSASTLALVTAAGIAAGLPAGAESGCGGSYTVNSGDTLARIAARCDTSVSALVRANEQITDPSLIRVGWRLEIPGASAGGGSNLTAEPSVERPGTRLSGSYTVEPGDTLLSIAQAAGITLAALMDANRGVNPYALAIGQMLNLPDRGLPPAEDREDTRLVSVEGRVSQGAECMILTTPDGDIYSLAGHMTFTPGEYVEVTGATADASTCMQGTPLRVTALSVVEPPRDERDDTRRVSVEGRVSQGAECMILTTPDGDVYSLSGQMTFTPGEYVKVTGETADASTCMQGTPLRVTALSEVEPTRDERAEDDTVRYQGRVASGAECPVLRTPDGDVYALVSDDVEFTTGEYVEVEGHLAEISTCMQGEGTLDVSEIREIAPSERERNRDRAEGPKLDLGYTPDRFSK